MESLIAYIPVDRRFALVNGANLPDRSNGSALFADISGFTPLTEALVRELGPLRGAEELSRHLNLVYDALINELHCFEGSVIGFSGDAIMCWLDGDNGSRATACALFMQVVMQQFSSVKITPEKTVALAMKAAVATGSARRFLVGDPEIQVIEVLAGTTLDHLAAAEHHANKGEVVLDETAISALGDQVAFESFGLDEHTGRKLGVVRALRVLVEPKPWPEISAEHFTEETIRKWLLPPVYERLSKGQGEFLAEFRPAVSLFLRFGGIDYDEDESAGEKLDVYIRQVQKVLQHYDGSLIQLTMGDKGSYLQAAFGAPIAHEDDEIRAVSAATELRKISPASGWSGEVQIGTARGHMRTGAYGGTKRRTYGVLGDEVNLAARLMQAAAPGQILVSHSVYEDTCLAFDWKELPPLTVKGRSDPVIVYSLLKEKEQPGVRLQEPKYALPMVGRVTERELIQQKLDLAFEGKGQIIGITGEAGMGKSRLVAEAIRIANERQWIGYGGECQSYGTSTSYLVWQNIWRGFFGLDPALTSEEKIRVVESQLHNINPRLVSRLPLLGAVLNLPIPDNELTSAFDAKLRKTSLEALLVDCLKERARERPMLLVLENCHWLDPLSHDLLEIVGRAIVDLPVLLLMAYRPFDTQYWKDTRVSHLPHFTEIHLREFTQDETVQLIRLKLKQFFGEDQDLPPKLVEHVSGRAEGNPFYIEELINYLQDRGLDPNDQKSLEVLDLPAGLHSLILTRLDQRTESQKITLKVASVIGRMFVAAWLWGAYPELGDPDRIKNDLDILSQLELTFVDATEPELIYLFKHIVTQEVAYESLPFATRALLHDQIAQFIERSFREDLEQHVDLLAYHYERSRNDPKKVEYLLKAGEAAQAKYANAAAIEYYRKVLDLLPREDKSSVLLKLGRVLGLVGEWQEADLLYQQAEEIAEQMQDLKTKAWCMTARAELFGKQGSYAEAAELLDTARQIFEEIDERAGAGQVLHYAGTMSAQQGDYDEARRLYEESLAIRRRMQDRRNIASLLNNLGILARYQRNYAEARAIHEEAVAIRRDLGDKWAIAASLINLGNVALDQGDYATAYNWLTEALTLQREVGDRFFIANAAETLGNVARGMGNYAMARELYNESLMIDWELGAKWHLAYTLEGIGYLEILLEDPARALRLLSAASRLRQSIGSPLPASGQAEFDRNLQVARSRLSGAEQEKGWAEGQSLTLEEAVQFGLSIDKVIKV